MFAAGDFKLRLADSDSEILSPEALDPSTVSAQAAKLGRTAKHSGSIPNPSRLDGNRDCA